jgi:hypothetical protein
VIAALRFVSVKMYYIVMLFEGGDVARTLIVERLQVFYKHVLTVLKKAKYFTS